MIRKCVNTIKYGTARQGQSCSCHCCSESNCRCDCVCNRVPADSVYFAAVVCVFVVITLAQTLVIQGGVVEDAKNAETQDTKRSKRTKPQDADKKVDHMKPPVFAKRKNEKEASNVEEEHNRHKRKKQQKEGRR